MQLTRNAPCTTTHLNTLSPDTAEPTSVEDVVNEDQCVLAVLGSDCTILNIQ
jgi:hypothetical protein